MKPISLLTIRVDSITHSDLLKRVSYALSGKHHGGVLPIFTINPEFVMEAQRNTEFRTILNKSWVNVADGTGILWAAKFLGTPLPERITGLQLLHALTKEAARHGRRVGFIGGQAGVAEKTKEYFQQMYPNLTSWADSGPRIELSNIKYEISNSLLSKIKKTDILFVAMGAPKQEHFINYLQTSYFKLHISHLVAVGVGGSFDEIAGVVPKTPLWIDRAGLKWLFRLITQPWRWRRQLRLVRFALLISITKLKQLL